jgi:type 1 glutamine amidotransferase
VKFFTSLILLLLTITPLRQEPVWRARPKNPEAIRALIVTGGHSHDSDFYSVFDDDRIRALVDPHPTVYGGDLRKRADVLVLYDMLREISPAQQQHLRDFIESGKGVVALHHAICGNVDWPWWYEEVAGGRYLFETVNGKKSSYIHDVEQLITPIGKHPVIDGVKPFRILDETYKDLWISPKVNVILKSDSPSSDGAVAWISPYEKSRVAYIQLGHDRNANLNPNYQKLVRQAILWAGGR